MKKVYNAAPIFTATPTDVFFLLGCNHCGGKRKPGDIFIRLKGNEKVRRLQKNRFHLYSEL